MKNWVRHNKRGAALIISILLLFIVTIIGISSIGSSLFETKISGNERLANAAFYASSGGVEVGVNRLPNIASYSGSIGNDATYRSGRMSSAVQEPAVDLGLMGRAGYETTWEFRRFQNNATGLSLGAAREVEVQTCYGPYSAGTSYNN